jgi:hypothetical protein
MDTRTSTQAGPFPDVPAGSYQGWNRVPSAEDNRELTRTGRGTPAGDYLRRFWQPVALVSDVGDLPVPLKIMGEKLVLFRDGSGRLGLMHRTAATAARRSNMGSSPSEASDAAITASSMTSMEP